MMAGNPNYWSMNGMHPQSHQFFNSQYVSASNIPSSLANSDSTTATADRTSTQDFPVRSWSQLLLGGLASGGEEERFGASIFQQQKKLENWEDQVLNLNSSMSNNFADVKPEINNARRQLNYNDHNHDDDQFNHPNNRSNWLHHQLVMPVSSPPTSCVTSLSNNFLNFSGASKATNHHHSQEHSSHDQCNSTSTGGVSKKPRVQQSSAQPVLKVRKEKLGDRITALHQLVSPFGKTDTASVLSEAIGYIRFLQAQIEALSSPYMRNASANSDHHQYSAPERNCLFPEEAAGQDSQSRGVKDLRSRGLCLVPISCTENVENDNGADYWAPAALGGGF